MAFRTPPRANANLSPAAPTTVLRDRWWWAPMASLYRWGVRCRHWAYDRGLRRSKEGALPTVVLGNVTVGGTGKTPHLKVLLRKLMDQEKDIRWAVLSRGYGRKTQGFLRVDREGTPQDVGDDPLEVARTFPGVPVYVCEDRLQGLEQIAQSGLADAVLLDDGLQHRKLRPTVGIALVDTTQPVDRDHFLPRGRLRDLPERIQEADAVILTRCPAALTKATSGWRHRLHLTADQPLLHTGTRPDGLRAMASKRYAGWPMRCIAVSGIAQPAQFEANSAAIAGSFTISPTRPPILHPGPCRGMAAALERPDDRGQLPEAIITTEKDVERIRPLAEAADLPILVLHLHIHWWDEEALGGLLSTVLQRVEASRSNPDI